MLFKISWTIIICLLIKTACHTSELTKRLYCVIKCKYRQIFLNLDENKIIEIKTIFFLGFLCFLLNLANLNLIKFAVIEGVSK